MTYKASLDFVTGRWFISAVENPSNRWYPTENTAQAAQALAREYNGRGF